MADAHHTTDDGKRSTPFEKFLDKVMEPLPSECLIDTQYNSMVRRQREEGWYDADMKRRYFLAMAEISDFYQPDQRPLEPYKETGHRFASRVEYIDKYRKALAAQLLTPCCQAYDVEWKRREIRKLNEWTPVSREQAEAALAADEAFVAAHPVKRTRQQGRADN